MLLLLVDPNTGLVARNASWSERLAARLRAPKLDRELAKGTCPDVDAALTLRALVLVAPLMRDELAGHVTRLMAQTTGPAGWPPRARVPIRRDDVVAAKAALRRLVDRLTEPGPLPVQGLAALHLLLTDGAGPLYYAGATVGFGEAVEQILTALGPRDGEG